MKSRESENRWVLGEIQFFPIGIPRKIMCLSAWLVLSCVISGTGLSQELKEEQFVAKSLDLRTALHYDPLLKIQLDSLVHLYEQAERLDELNGLYQAHVTQYPEDAGAKTVQIRILKKLKRLEADEQIAAAAQQHPEFAPLQYLLFQALDEKGDPRASEVLSRAIDLQAKPGRRSEWLERLLQLSEDETGRELAATHLKNLLEMEGQTGESLMKLAGVMQRYLYWELSLAALVKAEAMGLPPEAGIQAEILSAKADAAMGDQKKAGSRLDAVLARLASDHWLRSQVIRLRASVLASDAERAAMLAKMKAAYEAAPNKEAAIHDYAELLVAVDRREEAVALLLKGSESLPDSELLEGKTLELLRLLSDHKRLEKYLELKLERDPSLLALRYELVKVRYALGKPLDADQDFKAVLAALPEAESSQRVLDLARYLRTLKQPALAAGYFESFLKMNPTRLDVTRELAEVYLGQKNRKAAKSLLAKIPVDGAKKENILDLVQFLLAERFFSQAQKILTALLAADPNQFEFAVLLIEVLGETGDLASAEKWIDQIRTQADTPARYAKWLDVALRTHSSFETADRFFDSEQNRFTYSDAEWTPDRVEKFMALCEEGEKLNLKGRVSLAIRNQLAEAKLALPAKVKLRQLLVRSLENDPANIQETEEQLKLLATEDSARASEYDLQRAVIYHRSNRVDLAQGILGSLDIDLVKSVDLLRDAVPVMLEYGDLEMATKVLASITGSDPGDLFSWEQRLSILAAQGREKDFRGVIRILLQEVKEVKLRDSSREALALHMMDSYWRSVAKILSTGGGGNPEDALPLLDSVDRETPEADRFWTGWTRAFLLNRLGRVKEGKEAAAQLLTSLQTAKKETLAFPDGLSIATATAGYVLLVDELSNSKGEDLPVVPFPDQPEMRWAFEVDQGAKLLRFKPVSGGVVALDDRGSIYRIDGETGKLIWKENLGVHGDVRAVTPQQMIPKAVSNSTAAPAPESVIRNARSFLADDDSFYLTFGSEIRAYAVEDCRLRWRAKMPKKVAGEKLPSISPRGAIPETTLALGKGKIIVSDPVTGWVSGLDRKTGKMIWSKQLRSDEDSEQEFKLFSLNCGVSVAENQVFVFGRSSAVLNVHTGAEIWRFGSTKVRTFPIILRKDRNESAADAAALAGLIQQGDDSESWKLGASALPAGSSAFLIDYLTPAANRSQVTATFLNYPTSLVAPAVHWAENRVTNGVLADAHLGDGYLWLMGEGGVRRVSLSLPLASTEFPVSGSFLGETKNHAWFLDGAELIHADFRNKHLTRQSLAGLGSPGELRGMVHGAQVLVSSKAGLRIFHAITGRAVGQLDWPPELTAYLKKRLPQESGNPAGDVKFIWQGAVGKKQPGQSRAIYPVLDSVRGSAYFTVFDQRILVALGGRAGE